MSGVGYFERYGSSGIDKASLAGGAEVLFYAQGMAMEPSDNLPIFSSAALNFQGIGPALSCKSYLNSKYIIKRSIQLKLVSHQI